MNYKQQIIIYYILISITILFLFTPIIIITAQLRTGLVNKLRRRNTSMLGGSKPKKDQRVNYRGIPYQSERELRFRSDFYKNHYLPSLPYWRMDNEMPGVTRADRFRGNYNGYQYDYYRGRR